MCDYLTFSVQGSLTKKCMHFVWLDRFIYVQVISFEAACEQMFMYFMGLGLI